MPVPIFSTGIVWLKGEGPRSDIVMSSRVRLARNFAGFPFVNRCKRTDRSQVLDLAKRHLLDLQLSPQLLWIELIGLPQLERSLLVERHLISTQHSKGEEPRAVAVSTPDETLSIMVNEEDHLRIQVIRSGLALSEAFEQIDAIDDRIEDRIDFAYSPRFGYLTACPTNVGTGIRVSVMLHLPGLRITGEIEKVKRAAESMCLAVRGFYGEGSEAVGDFFQLSNQTTLGKSERAVLQDFEHRIIPKIIEYERLARRSLMEKRRHILEDQVFRALGTLRYARQLKADEALQLLSLARLGVHCGLLPDVNPSTINELILLVQSAHLQKAIRREIDQAERRIERARLVRSRIGAPQT